MEWDREKVQDITLAVTSAHSMSGGSAVRLQDGEPIYLDAMVEVEPKPEFTLTFEGPLVPRRKGVRRLLFEIPDAIKRDSKSVIWSAYDEAEDTSVLGIGLLKEVL